MIIKLFTFMLLFLKLYFTVSLEIFKSVELLWLLRRILRVRILRVTHSDIHPLARRISSGLLAPSS
jgi:hypothetical protein